jgi:alkylation response protein AidB-like acyl-CoA dehydrogenase
MASHNTRGRQHPAQRRAARSVRVVDGCYIADVTPVPDRDPRESARRLAPLIRESANEAERERRLPARVATAMAEAGLYRIAAPLALGGGECDPRTQIETIEVVSYAGGAAGWNLMIGIENLGFLGAALPKVTGDAIFADPHLIVSGALNPLGRAREVDGGFQISGQWPFASGCHNAQYFWGQCVVYDGDEPARSAQGGNVLREALIPAAEFEILDTWQVGGLRGSGSHDVRAQDVFVPHERITKMMDGQQLAAGALFRFPILPRLAYNKVGVATGIARAAIDHFITMAERSTRRGSTVPLRDRPAAHLAVANAEATLRSARAFVFEAVEDVWETVQRHEVPTPRQNATVHLACSHAAAAAIHTVEQVHTAAGSVANFETSPLERCIRDVRVVPQHIMASAQWIEFAGRTLLASAGPAA